MHTQPTTTSKILAGVLIAATKLSLQSFTKQVAMIPDPKF
jgi:hypothetical protein